MLFCAVAAVMATGMATILMTYTAASSIVSIVMAVYSVSEGNNLSALTRGWTNETIAEAINNPVKLGNSVNKYTGYSVTLYYVDDIHYVAIDDVTNKVIQVADLRDPYWVMNLFK